MNVLQRYICRRLLGAVPVLFGISLLAFVLAQLSPGDPAEIMLEGAGMGMPSAEDVAALRSYLGLDKPAYVQYGLWLWRLLQGDGGLSYHLSGRSSLALGWDSSWHACAARLSRLLCAV